ncbi:MAG: YdcF family protein [Alphaproteobacteria bacterium]|nr:YdcF family protein [Alphaproteobacteria bacterium]
MRGLARKFIFCFGFFAFVWLCGLVWFLGKIEKHIIPREPCYCDKVVVLTGGSGRIELGLKLFSEHPIKRLFISGAGKTTTLQDIIKKAPAELRGAVEAQSQNIILGHEAENTIGNAEEVSAWLEGQSLPHNICLVTSNYHMPRASSELRYMLPKASFCLENVYDETVLGNWWMRTDSRQLILSEYHKFIASKLRHLFVSVTAAS